MSRLLLAPWEGRRCWLCVGSQENWEVSWQEKLWGEIPGIHRDTGKLFTPHKAYEECVAGDLVFFYTTGSSGIRGWGIIEKKFKDDKRLIWPREKKSGKVIFSLRFTYFRVARTEDNEHREPITEIADLNLDIRGMNELRKEQVDMIMKKISIKWHPDAANLRLALIKREASKERAWYVRITIWLLIKRLEKI